MEYTETTEKKGSFTYWIFMACVVVGLYFTRSLSYLLFHSIVELFSIIVAASVFIITWKSVRYIKNPYLLMVGVASLFIGILDLLHTLSFKGMRIFLDYDYYANQLWVSARFLESLTLLAAFSLLYTKKRVDMRAAILGYALVTFFLIASIFYWKIFPICFIEGQGLTPFKVYSEYVICGILIASLFLLMRNKDRFSAAVYRLLFFSIVYTIVSELCFTLYTDNYGIANMVGHYFKLFSFAAIYQAIVSTGIEEPYDLIFKELHETNRALEEEVARRQKVEAALKENEEKLQAYNEELQARSEELQDRNVELAHLWDKSRQSEEALQKLNEVLDKRVAERTQELREKDHLLMQQSRLAAMGEMINNIAHQWRQPLNSLGLLVQEIPLLVELGEVDEAAVTRNSAKSMELVKHMSQTIEDFRNFFRPDREKVVFHISHEVRRTLSLIEGSLEGKGIKVEVVVNDDAVVTGFPNEFSQVLINIINNARDALVEREVEDPRVVITVGTEEGRAIVTIADNAGGIPQEIMGKIFAPYFTTKGPQNGTGVGLFMSKNIIERSMGGLLTVRNVEEGAEFRIVV
ncbi:ATP-binding protein [Geomonas sp. RF6]|uniref:MASE3 domain-containing protein n=1 Tax=Geomonas sp. RF6 TaxID=2897342 RepID=UPI001E32A79D|nr:MASE3 domain-containing protein [Geomonas sp. RF6]UFS70101.1 ATP-binding protein [Geomonas sp. RF6]